RLHRRTESRVADRRQRAIFLATRRVRLRQTRQCDHDRRRRSADDRAGRATARRIRRPAAARAVPRGQEPGLSRSVVAAMTAYTLELREAEIKLNQNESPFDFPRALKERVLARMADRAW